VDSVEAGRSACVGGTEVVQVHYLWYALLKAGEFCVFVFNLDKEVSAMQLGI
jgi:hypothetical protein